ncbi:hypothetical protein FVE85_0441 [Porphyridium purpureum]|uniref:Uncharacterized protein n=1 Tax=Porphyridium purpureum TaxID=35688 RepID=A0A5J4Z0R1_PORPP|nr:hypothetical protein FVE85_0441 [Porphyridium purpureum]|eukprot:POR0830..scf208_2
MGTRMLVSNLVDEVQMHLAASFVLKYDVTMLRKVEMSSLDCRLDSKLCSNNARQLVCKGNCCLPEAPRAQCASARLCDDPGRTGAYVQDLKHVGDHQACARGSAAGGSAIDLDVNGTKKI